MTPDVPIYPNATLVKSQHVSLMGGGGGTHSGYATDDAFETVVVYYEQHLGPCDRDSAAGTNKWLRSDETGKHKRLVIVESGNALKSPVTASVPGTSVCLGSLFFARHSEDAPNLADAP